MPTDKETKKWFKAEASKDPDKYYATSVLKSEGFSRKQCPCGTYFWSMDPDQIVCGDPACSGGFRFIGNTPVKKEMDYVKTWKTFAKLFENQGYTPIPRYPVVARWRDDEYWVGASIYNFQPYVVSGEIKPPANPLVVPQFCLRFNDIDNVGITGQHYVGFVMIGQHAFMPPEKWDQKKYFSDIHNWLKTGLGLPNNEITFHEDAWAGGGNFGPSMEYFSRGLELGNQVYMMYEQTPKGNRELNLKVLDMGMGHERNAWFSKGLSTSYETTFPTVCKKLFNKTGIKLNQKLMRGFLPLSSYLNVDEVDNINKAWAGVADKLSINLQELRDNILPLAAIFSIAEHSRASLFAINDGALPSNVGGGYNLRIIIRRAMSFIDKYHWDLDIPEICEEHANYLKPLFPELKENLDTVTNIINVEKQKYLATRQKTKQLIATIANQKLDEKQLIRLYDSQGISPDLIKEEAQKLNKEIKIPDDFYTKVTETHAETKTRQEQVKEKLPLEGIPETKALYYENYENINCISKVLAIIDNHIILDQTCAYPTSGGQLHDQGTINDIEITEITKQGSIIIHTLTQKPTFNAGDKVKVSIDFDTRLQLSQHHTAAHIINTAARAILGKHINQSGARKTIEKATLDITHYQRLTDEETALIELESNKIIQAKIPVKLSFMPREDAEKKFGMAIYQGGAVPGKNLRIVQIGDLDIEACGGTHCNNTLEVGEIKIIKSSKISDSTVRLEFVAGKRATEEQKTEQNILSEAAKLLNITEGQVPARANELFDKWKQAKKIKKKIDNQNYIDQIKKGEIGLDLELTSTEQYQGDALAETAKILRTQPEHITKTLTRFLNEFNSAKDTINEKIK